MSSYVDVSASCSSHIPVASQATPSNALFISECLTHLTIDQRVLRIRHASVPVGATVRVQIGILLLRRGSCSVRHEVWQVRGRSVERDSLSAR